MRHRCFICDDAGWFTHEGVTYGCDCEPGLRHRLEVANG